MDIIPQLILNSIIAGAIYSMIALGFNLIYGTAGVLIRMQTMTAVGV